LLACADEEQHTLALEALAAGLAEAGVESRFLGARVPAGALAAVIERTGPLVVVVWSQSAATADAGQWTAVLPVRPRPAAIFAAGPGWNAADLPAAVERPSSLADAINRIVPAATA
jgi:MerR family transcriptional regulator, light-induced transcriptional regulator